MPGNSRGCIRFENPDSWVDYWEKNEWLSAQFSFTFRILRQSEFNLNSFGPSYIKLSQPLALKLTLSLTLTLSKYFYLSVWHLLKSELGHVLTKSFFSRKLFWWFITLSKVSSLKEVCNIEKIVYECNIFLSFIIVPLFPFQIESNGG